jgi:hypothetical protein
MFLQRYFLIFSAISRSQNRGDRTSEKTCDRPIQQKKYRAIAFSWAMAAIAFANASQLAGRSLIERSPRESLSQKLTPFHSFLKINLVIILQQKREI